MNSQEKISVISWSVVKFVRLTGLPIRIWDLNVEVLTFHLFCIVHAYCCLEYLGCVLRWILCFIQNIGRSVWLESTDLNVVMRYCSSNISSEFVICNAHFSIVNGVYNCRIQCKTTYSRWTKCFIHLLTLLSSTGVDLWSDWLYAANWLVFTVLIFFCWSKIALAHK